MQTVKDEIDEKAQDMIDEMDSLKEEEKVQEDTKKESKKKKEVVEEVQEEKLKKEKSEVEKLLKMKPEEQIKYLLGEIEIIRNQQSVLENRIARYKKLKKV